MSTEFIERKVDDGKFIEIMYSIFFDRKADVAGEECWLNRMKNGEDREKILGRLTELKEFGEICKGYGIRYR